MNAAINAFLASAGKVLSAGIATVEDAVALVDLVKTVLGKDQPTDADWTSLHTYEAKQTAILDGKMEGE